MTDQPRRSIWLYWVGIIAVISAYVAFQAISQPFSDCDRLMEQYLHAYLNMEIAASMPIGGESARAEARARLNLARFELVESCGSRAPFEAEKYYHENGKVLIE